MKKSPIKEFIITSISAAVAGYVVKKGYDYFKKKSNSQKNWQSLPSSTSKGLVKMSENVEDLVEEGTPAQKGLVATVAYTVATFIVSKFLRKII